MRKLIGDKQFYRMLLTIMIPIAIQNGITNFVNLIDNIMIGTVGTDQMSGVSIVNQLIFVFVLTIFGAISGAGIFTAQFYGQKNQRGIRNAFRFKLVISSIFLIISLIVFKTLDQQLISLYLHEGGETGDIQKTLEYGRQYLSIMVIGLIPFTIVQCYSGTLRETGQTLVPMKAGVVAVVTNLVINYILIYGKFGAPALGVQGAAIGTVVSRFVELFIVVYWTHKNTDKNEFIKGVFRGFHIPKDLAKGILKTGFPLLINEILWVVGFTMLIQFYSTKGLAVVAAFNINSVITNVFNIVYIAIGNSVAIIIGHHLGARNFELAKLSALRTILFTFVLHIFVGMILFVAAPLFPEIYNTTDEVKQIATNLIRVVSVMMPIYASIHCSFFTIRSGGKTIVTFIFDCVFMWGVSIPLAFCLTRFTELPILYIYMIVQSVDFAKLAFGLFLVNKGIWLSDIVKKF